MMHFGELEGDALFATGRVLVLAVMVGFASHMMFDALLLQWVRASMLNMGVDVFPSVGADPVEGHADESPLTHEPWVVMPLPGYPFFDWAIVETGTRE